MCACGGPDVAIKIRAGGVHLRGDLKFLTSGIFLDWDRCLNKL